jgi:hypothetical protein
MDKDSVLIYNLERGFGEIFWVACPVCWNSMKVTRWEDGEVEENCPACWRNDREMMEPGEQQRDDQP